MTAVMAGCNKSDLITGGDETGAEIGNHYIHFDTGITTRASLYEHDDTSLRQTSMCLVINIKEHGVQIKSWLSRMCFIVMRKTPSFKFLCM